ncbi:adenosylcobinamide-GDP ribazoletransferase [Methanosphaera sp. ISO3-F5]|uniref:adenosylcobinamide-GDP ribazoletransferase n=1 Tax=Methanosphaera sp. ISO3-F5 TaxID=1452353 RepID=UPI002B25D961|nr:adenosylcobinamide-GDP ribazoletransferase [Methanosphaera sp. ISO3-F5]WQH64552.1 adenosylcobinamide-GDP ribazoletransferase [Methanosphaera sp. ISO3-F5]
MEKSDKTVVHPNINGILGIISFSTRIPVNRYVGIEDMASSVIIWPYVGLLIGVLGALLAYISHTLLGLSTMLTAVLVYIFIIWFTGFNHVDGVMDMGDGLMVHGDPEKRLTVMRDSMVGTGGIATFFVVASLTLAALASIPPAILIPSVLIMEFASKFSMVTSMVIGKDDTRGIGRLIKSGINSKILFILLIINSVIGYFILGIPGVCAIIASVATGLYLAHMADKTFGCVTGDIMGASNEIARVTSLIVILIVFNFIG